MNIEYYKGHNAFFLFNKYKSNLDDISSKLEDNINVMVINNKCSDMANHISYFTESLPFLSNQKYIFFYNLSTFCDTDTQKKILEILDKNIDYMNFYFFEEIPKDKKDIDARLALYKYLQKYLVKEYHNLSENDIDRWVLDFIKKSGHEIDNDALFLLRQLTELDMWAIKNALDKLVLYKSHDSDISKSDVQNVVAGKVSAEVFDMMDQVVRKNKSGALKVLKKLIFLDEDPIALIRMMQYNFKVMYLIKYFSDNESILTKNFAIHPYVIKKNRPYLSKYNLYEILNLYEMSIDAEVNIRMGIYQDGYIGITKIIDAL